MRTKSPPRLAGRNRLLASTGLAAFILGSTCATAQETWIYAARVSGTTWTPPFWEIQNGGGAYATSTGKSTATGVNASRVGCWYHTASTMVDGQGFGCQLTNDTAVGATWKVSVTIPSSNGSTDLIMSVGSTNADWGAADGSGPLTQTDAFQSTKAGNKWALVGYLTNRVGTGYSGLHPQVTFGYISGGTGNTYRSYADSIKFEKVDECALVSAVSVVPPYQSNATSVVVTDVAADALAVTVYQRLGNGAPTQVGKITSGIVAGDNVVNVSGLTAGQNIMATQTRNVGGKVIEGCVSAGYPIGAGPNSQIKVSLNIRNNSAFTGPIGAPGTNSGYGYYFMPNTAKTSAGYPQGGITITPSTCWQTVKIDPRTVSHSDIWAGSGTGDPGYPAWGAIDSLIFDMADTGNTGPYAIYIDNLANGTTLIHDWEDAIEQGALTNAAPGLFAAHTAVGSTYPLLNTNPVLVTVACTTNATAPNQCAGGTNAQFISWQWNQAGSPGVWLRMYANASGVAAWPSFPQVDLTKPIYFDILVLPVGQTAAHSVGTVTWMDDTNACPGQSVTLSVTATPPTDPTTGTPQPRSYTYQWSQNGVAIPGATANAFTTNGATAASGTYSVVVSDGTCSLTRSAQVTMLPVAAFSMEPMDVTVNVGDTAYLSGSAAPVAPCSAPISYQWRRYGTNLPGATTAFLTIPNCQIADAAPYSLAATNSYGAVYSSNAWVHVLAPNPVYGSGNGLLGLYYSNSLAATPFSGTPAWTNTDYYSINFDGVLSLPNWGANAPDALVNNPSVVGTNNFTARFVGKIQAKWAQTYTFYVKSDDGARLWVDSKLLIDAWKDQSATEYSGTIALTTNLTPIVLEYYEKTGDAILTLSWESASQVKEIVPMIQMYSDATSYPGIPSVTLTAPANNASFTQPAMVDLAATAVANNNGIDKVQFLAGTTVIGEAVNPPFTATWTNPAAGNYSISARALYSNASRQADSSSVNITVVAVTPPSIGGIALKDGNLQISGTGPVGKNFILLSSPDLTVRAANWTRVATNSAGTGVFSFTITPGTDPQAFYNVKAE